jgi:hypothetical protein
MKIGCGREYRCGMRKHKGRTRLRQRAGVAKLTTMPLQKYFLSAICVLVLGCGSDSKPPKPPEVAAAFPSLPLPPSAQFVSRAGSADALQLTFFSPAKTPMVTEYYRKMLSSKPWRLVSDVANRDTSRVLYAEQAGRPMWVRVWSTSDGEGTMVELSGAAVKQSAAPAETGSSAKGGR